VYVFGLFHSFIIVAFRDVRRIELFSNACSNSFLNNGHLFTSFASLKKRYFYLNSFNNLILFKLYVPISPDSTPVEWISAFRYVTQILSDQAHRTLRLAERNRGSYLHHHLTSEKVKFE